MTELICSVCGCAISSEAYEKEGVRYCCESCATGQRKCECDCSTATEE